MSRVLDILKCDRNHFAVLVDVSHKFMQQTTPSFLSSDYTTSSLLAERIRNGACYFSERLCLPLNVLRNKVKPTGNKQNDKKIELKRRELLRTLEVKLALLHNVEVNGFDPQKYKKIRYTETANLSSPSSSTAAQLKKNSEGSKSSTIVRNVKTEDLANGMKQEMKPKKESTREITWKLFSKGYSVDEISKLRNLTVSTIYSHLISYIAQGKLRPDQLVSHSHQQLILKAIKSLQPPFTLTAIREQIGDEVSFDEIKVMLTVHKYDGSPV